jgi:hypothetical protein
MRQILFILALAFAVEAAAQPARPVDTLQFGLLQLGSSQAEVQQRLGPPAHIETETRQYWVPVYDRFDQRKRHDAPRYVMRTLEIERWYYPGTRQLQATLLEFRNGRLHSKDKY